MNVPSDRNRRAWISYSARSLLGVASWSLLPRTPLSGSESNALRPSASASRVIYLFMAGGMSHLDSFDTKPGSDTQGPVESIATSVPGQRISEHFPTLAQHMHHVAVINSMHSTQGAHGPGQYYMHTSYFQRGTIQHPDLGAYTSLLLDKQHPTLPTNVKIGSGSSGLGAGFLESRHAAVPIGHPEEGLQHHQRHKSVTEDRLTRRLRHLAHMNGEFAQQGQPRDVRAYCDFYDEAVRLMGSKDVSAFDLKREPATMRERYGQTPFGQGCLLARRLIEHDVRFVEVTLGGWDTHTNNFERVAEQGAILDQALGALLPDLVERGLLESTLVVVATEFGRTPDIATDRDNGRNHYPKAFSCLLAGGGIQGGGNYGATDAAGREIESDAVEVPDFNATIATTLGMPLDREIISPSRRPFTVADKGRPVAALLPKARS